MTEEKTLFKKVSTKVDFIGLENDILSLWEREGSFAKSVQRNAGNRTFSFIDGPITANNPMGVHHAWGRTYKDIFLRYHAMQGCDMRRQNGFDCQGLWVEVEVEKELGLNSKRDIEAYGLGNFSRKCRDRVLKYAGIISQQSVRLGQWMDWDNSYYTMSDTNIDYIWHFLRKCRERNWLYKGHRAMPWCARCGTSLSQHELIDSYKEMTHTSVYVRLPLAGREREFMLVWTTTPWTLSSNTALSIHPELRYAKVKQGDDIYYLSEKTLGALKGDYEILDTLPGRAFLGQEYEGPFDELAAQSGVRHRIIPWEEVGEEEGTGIVHTAPGCGAEDFELGKKHGLSVIVPIDENGFFVKGFGFLTGKSVMKVSEEIFDDLRKKGRLYRTQKYEHRYPVCWRCGEELVFMVNDEWFISCEEIRQPMIDANRTVKWYPDFGGRRMEDWLMNMGDWCISRKRYWGLPLPFYYCGDCGAFEQLGSRKELEERAVSGLEQLCELHRPWIDAVKIKCSACGGTSSRITEVGDCWLDAGIVPFSTLGYLDSGQAYWNKWFPADFITEMREQIRLWFYSQLFMSVTLTGKAPYRQVMIYEKAMDEHGKPMHKSHGNAIWFNDAAEKMGADVMRWIYASQNLVTNLRFGYAIGDEVRRKILTLWNTYSFFVTYANIDGFIPREHPLKKESLTLLDRWILARLQELVVSARKGLDGFNTSAVTREAERFLDDLSNWYVRRSRRRFWKSENDADKLSAYGTLYTALVTFCRLLAPVIPFLTEEMYQNLVRRVDPEAPESIHHSSYPDPDAVYEDPALIAEMDLVKKIVEMGRSIRNRVQIKVRQPLAEMMVQAADERERRLLENHRDEILEELNIKKLSFIDNISQLVSETLKLKYNILGKKYGKTMKLIEGYFRANPANEELESLKAGNSATLAGIMHEGRPVTIEPDEVTIESAERGEIASAEDGPHRVALDIHLSPELKNEGMAREFIRLVQNMRKEMDFEVTDQISITYSGSGAVGEALKAYDEYIMKETLARSLTEEGAGKGIENRKIGDTEIHVSIERLT